MKQRSFVWNHFEKMDGNQAKCSKCGEILACAGGTTSSLRYHLLAIHQIQKPDARQPTLSSLTSSFTAIEKKRMDKLALWYVIKDLHSFCSIERDGLKKWLNCLNPKYKQPSRQTLRKMLDEESILGMAKVCTF